MGQAMVNRWRNTRILHKITAAYLCLVIIPLFTLLGYNYQTLSTQYRQELVYKGDYVINLVLFGMSKRLDAVETAIHSAATNGSVVSFLSKTFSGASSYEEYEQTVVPILRSLHNSAPLNITRLHVVTRNSSIPDGYNIIYNEAHYASADLEEFIASGQDTGWVFHPDRVILNDRDSYASQEFTYCERIVSPYGKLLGYIVAEVPSASLLEGFLLDGREDAAIFLLDDAGNPIISNMIIDETTAESLEQSRKTGYMAYLAVPAAGLPLTLAVVLTSEGQSLLTQNAFLIVAVMAVLFSVFLTIFYWYLKDILGRLRRYTQEMGDIVENNFATTLAITQHDEIGELGLQFNNLLARIKWLLATVVQKETAHKTVQLQALLLQINPHFIYNTLDMFVGKLLLEGMDELSIYLTSFTHMIRYNTVTANLFTALRHELEHTDNYINLQRCRYGNTIDFSVHCPEMAWDLDIMRFLIQPIVENAFTHGFEDKDPTDRKRIRVGVRTTRSGGLLIRVWDNGCGISPVVQRQMNAAFAEEREIRSLDYGNRSIGIGLSNINDRLKLFYGKDSRLIVRSVEGSYTSIFIWISGGGSHWERLHSTT